MVYLRTCTRVQCSPEVVVLGGFECFAFLNCRSTAVSSLLSSHVTPSPDRGEKMSSGGGGSEVTVSHKRKKRKEHQSSVALEPKSIYTCMHNCVSVCANVHHDS